MKSSDVKKTRMMMTEKLENIYRVQQKEEDRRPTGRMNLFAGSLSLSL
jgi:hypothetical protein